MTYSFWSTYVGSCKKSCDAVQILRIPYTKDCYSLLLGALLAVITSSVSTVLAITTGRLHWECSVQYWRVSKQSDEAEGILTQAIAASKYHISCGSKILAHNTVCITIQLTFSIGLC